MDDVGEWWRRRLTARLTQEEVRALERDFRQEWGGQATYVKKAPSTLKTYALADCLAAGTALSEAREVLGISRTTCFRLLARRWAR